MSGCIPPRPTDLLHQLLSQALREGDTVVDATAGNGHDTLFLARAVGTKGKVIAFDVQQKAIDATAKRLKDGECDTQVTLVHNSHGRMLEHVERGSAAAVVFNLGYLPGEDHGLTTTTVETLGALGLAIQTLRPGGALAVVCYPGHPEGAVEAREVEEWLTLLPPHGYRVAKYQPLGTRNPAPFLLLASRV